MRTRIICWLALLGPLAWLFGAVLVERRVCNFRDIAHYYRPLWQWTSAHWATGSVPLWNPFDGLGLPIHADPTASLFYPGQLLFALPVDFTTRLNLYLMAHVLLAAATLYSAARHWGASSVGAAAGAVSYAYGGQVLFQYCNPIYLVSAAWLPLALLAAQRMLTERSYRWGAVLATTLALMVLGGDPQMAYHVLLLAALYAWLLWRSEPKSSLSWRSSRGVLLGAAAVGAGLLAAIQILPTAEWSARSERAAFEEPRNVWEAGQYLVQVNNDAREAATSSVQAIASGLFASPTEDSHHEQAYEFSVGPWRWLEFFWPNIGGRMFPTHRRWMSAIPAESRIWTPSIYIGLAPFLIALIAFSLRRTADLTTRWFSWMVVLGLLGALGVYGIGWLLHELHLARGLGAAVGGLYWFFVVLLPGYVQFRYPAKLLVLASVGLSLLAARGWDAALLQPFARARRGWLAMLTALVVLSLLGMWLAYSEVWRAWGPLRVEYPFGPLDRDGAAADLFYACLQTCVVSLIIGGLLVVPRWRSVVPMLLLIVTAIELSIAHGWMITSSPADSAPELAALPAESHWERRFYGGPHREFPSEQAQANSASRLDEILDWEIAHPQGKWHLAGALNRVDAESSLEPRDMAAIWKELATHRPERATADNLPLLAMGTAWNLSEARPELQSLPKFGDDGTNFSS
ncbi:MAG TPA: YfhO family protein, partial [Pirellulaceae bacterium]|nr:YfhO family protein [Pirellulaceae bacterium]